MISHFPLSQFPLSFIAFSGPMPEETVSFKIAESTKFLEWIRISSVFFFAVTALFEPGTALVLSAEKCVSPLAWRAQLSEYQAVRKRQIVVLKHIGRIPTCVLPNENLNYTGKENMAATLYKQSFSLQFFYAGPIASFRFVLVSK